MSIFNYISEIPDPRKDINKKHELVDVIFLVFSAVLSGASGWKSIQEFGELQLDWLKQYAPFENGIPRRHCIANIIKLLDSDILVEALFLWINERRAKDGKKLIAIDGKTMRGTRKTSISQALHVVSAYDVGAGVALYQKATESKGKEGPIGREIIELLALENAIVTMDALHCQVETLDLITQRKGDYIVGVKNNQKRLYQFVKEQFSAAYDTEEFVEFTEQNKGHGRLEHRTVMQLNADLPDDLKKRWPSIRSLIEVVSERGKPGDIHRDSRWYVSSLPLNAEVAARAIRQHWGIENQLHWVLDVVFREDELSLHDLDGAAHMALFNRVALSVIKQHTGLKDSIASKRRRAAWSADFRSELVFG